MQVEHAFCPHVLLCHLNQESYLSGGEHSLLDEAELSKRLRFLVDTFLDSGTKSDGSEEPKSRLLPTGSEAESVVLKWVSLQIGTLHWHAETGLTMGTFMGLDAWSGADDLQSRTEIEATRLFSLFMDSDSRWLLVRCHRCQKYDIRKSLLDRYVHGWHCAKCRKPSLAIISTCNSRRRRKEKWFGLVMATWPKSEGKRDRIGWVTEQVNKSLASHEKIKRNTITRSVRENPEKFLLIANGKEGQR